MVADGARYFPPQDVDANALHLTWRISLCPYKGIARHFTADSGIRRVRRAAWTYRRPFRGYGPIRRYVAFADPVDVAAHR